MRTCSRISPLRGLLAVVAFGVSALPSQAAFINGSFQFSGQVTVSSTTLDFLNLGVGGASDGSISMTGGSGYFASYNLPPDVNSPGTIKDLSSAPGLVNILNSIVISAGARAGTSVTFTEIFAGGGPACPPLAPSGSSCTLPGSPLLITRTAGGGTSVTMVVRADVINGGDSGYGIGTFTAQFSGTPPETLLATVGGGGTVTTSYSADFQMAPEPASVVSCLLGLGLVGFGIRRHRA